MIIKDNDNKDKGNQAKGTKHDILFDRNPTY